MRKIIPFNDEYIFIKEGVSELVTIPHTWNAEDGQGNGTKRSYYRGICTYKKKFPRPQTEDGEQVYLEFQGVNSSTEVRLNGKEIKSHQGGYSTFRVNLTEKLQAENELEIFVDNGPNDRVYPQKADFTFYGGIYRDVSLIIVPETHFDLDYYGGKGLRITPHVENTSADVELEVYYTGRPDEIKAAVEGVGEITLTPDREKEGTARGILHIPQVHLWNGIKDPFLYHVAVTLYENGEAVDEISDSFGCRTYSFDAEKGFYLNGESYPLHGVSRHQDRQGVGNALTREMHEEDIELILSMGANSIRLAHYQHDQYFYELCDKKGIVVWAEIPYITVHLENGRENTISQMKELIVQNYNHASIICWAISNEISLQGVTEDLLENHQILNDLIHKMDPYRVSAMANLFLLETDSPLVALPDICGYNLYYGWYVGDMEDNDAFFDKFHEEHPDIVIGLTEYGADSVLRLQSPKPEKGDYTESYQAVYHEHMLEMIHKRPYLWGTYVWNMFEFAAADREEAGDPGKNHKGLITFDRKQKKDAFYIYKAWWSDEPFIHLCGKRYRDRIEPVTEIKVYTNQKRVSLFVDNKPCGEMEGKHIFKFELPISGEHHIRVSVPGTPDLMDEMTIRKTDTLNPDYFMDSTKVRNWFDEPQEEEEKEGYLSLNSTMAEIQAVPAGAALLAQVMTQMQGKVAGGMGKDVQISEAMQQIVARQPLKKLLSQAGIEEDSKEVKALVAALAEIPKAGK